MKIALICPDPERSAHITGLLAGMSPPLDKPCVLPGLEGLAMPGENALPELLLVDRGGLDCLPALEALMRRQPSPSVLLIAPETSPDFLLGAMRAGIREVLPEPFDADAMAEALGRLRALHLPTTAESRAGRILSFIASKGGSGATFLATNLGYALAAERDCRVALIDLNLQFGDAALFVSDQHPPSNIAEVAREIHRLDASFLASAMLEVRPGFQILAAPEDPAHAPDVKREHVDAILRLARKHYDFVLIDVARSLDALSLQALDLSDVILPVAQLTLPFVRDSKRLVSIFRSLGYSSERIHLLVNRYSRGGEISLEDLERTVGEKVFSVIPNSYVAAASSVNLGIPVIKSRRNDPISRSLIELAARLTPHADTPDNNTGWLNRIFGRTG